MAVPTTTELPYRVMGAGLRTELGTLLPPGGIVQAYVRSGGVQDLDDENVRRLLVTTLNAGLARCRASMGDIVVVLPGHAETISSADYMSSLVAGTQIVGVGTGTLRPTFTWSAAAATFLLDVANVSISNCIFKMAGSGGGTALTVAQAMTISAAGCALIDCDFQCEVDANEGATLGVVTTAAADDLTIQGCKFYGSSNGTLPTTYLRLVGADRLKMYDCDFFGATSSATVGVVQMITTASTNVDIRRCNFTNLATGAVHAATGLAASTGHMADCVFEPPLSLPSPEDFDLAPGAHIFFVDSNAATSVVNFAGIAHDFSTTVNAALAKCRASKGDAVVCLPGHTESVAAADSWSALLAGTRVIGTGQGTLRPTFTWTAADATILLNVANATIENCILKMADSANAGVTVAAPITISAAGCQLLDNTIYFGDDVDDNVTIGITTTAAADDLVLKRNHCIGATAAECTTFMDIIGADRLLMEDNVFEGATSATGVGIVRFATTASLNIRLYRNVYINRKASSAAAVTGLAAVSGVSHQEHFAYLDTVSLTPWVTSTGIMTFHRPTVTNTAGETGTEVVGTVSA